MTHPRDSPALFVEANGIRYAYRRFGEETGVPLLFMQHFRGGLDHWDPAITDGFGRDRPVILFDNAGVASSSGETPGTVEAMVDHARDFVSAISLRATFEIFGSAVAAIGVVAFEARLTRPTDPRIAQYEGTPGPSIPETHLIEVVGATCSTAFTVRSAAASLPAGVCSNCHPA